MINRYRIFDIEENEFLKKIINNNEVNSTSASLLTVSGDREDEVVMPVAKK